MTQSPLLGFNNNVKHRGRLFHIQTEDSGVRHPHVITHLFMDGGRILKTVKTSYAEHVGSDKMAQVVRDLMKEQHKMMFIALRDGQFDHVLGDSVPPPSTAGPPAHPHASPQGSGRTAPAATTLPPNTVVATGSPTPATAPAARASSTSTAAMKAPAQGAAPAARPSSTTTPAAKAPSVTMPAVKSPSVTMPAVKQPSGTMAAPAAPAVRAPSGTMAAPVAPVVRAPSGTMAAPVAPVVRAPSGTMAAPVAPTRTPSGTMRQPTAATAPSAPGARPSPPSSSAMRAATAEGGPSTGVRPVPRREAPDIFGTPATASGVVVADQAAAAAADNAGKENKPKEQPGSGRYAASRPAAIFANARNADAGGSIFGDDLISEKSLDEVILSYLSDDLDSPGSKK